MTPDSAGSSETTKLTYRVGDLTIDTARHVVSRGGREILLGKLTYEFLLLLVESAPNLVTRDDMARALWANRLVTEDTVRQRVKLLRKALSDDSKHPRYFEVVRGQGYRLIPEVLPPVAVDHSMTALLRRASVAVASGGALMLAVALFFDSPSDITPAPPVDNTIAVLPFEALTRDPEDRIFIDGFHNDLLTQLSTIEDLDVISRTSVVEYRGTEKNLRRIGEELGAATILEGSVQRSGNQLRINAQLIDARMDRHLWASIYEREVTAANLFAVQAEIADAITLALQIELSPEESGRVRDVPTQNTSAYNHYLLGLHYAEQPDFGVSRQKAAESFQRAVDEDPEFAVAWAALANVHGTLYFFGDYSMSRRDQSRYALGRALSLNSNLPEVQMALGYYQFHIDLDYEAALQTWEAAEARLPGEPGIDEARSHIYTRMGDFGRAIESLEKSLQLDPRNVSKLVALAWRHALAGNLESAESVLNEIVVLAPDRTISYLWRSYLRLWQNGDTSAMREELAAAPVPVTAPVMEWVAEIYDRDYEGAIKLLDSWQIDNVRTRTSNWPRAWFYGTTYRLAGHAALAVDNFREAEEQINQLLSGRPDDPELQIRLASIKANLGDQAGGIALAKQVLERLPETRDASTIPNVRLSAVRVFLAAGANDDALAELRDYLDAGSFWTIDGLLPDPRLDPVRDDPRLLALIEQHSANPVQLAEVNPGNADL